MPSAVVLGARNLGGAVATHLAERGHAVAAVARSASSFDGIRDRVVRTITADAADPAALERALAEAADALGGLDLVVNAVSASRPPAGGARTFGGGPVADATLEDVRGWCVPVVEQAFVFLSTGARALRARGGGTLVQVTGGSARRAFPGRGPWAAGAHATRALVHAAAQELRGEGIHVALLVADGTIASPKTAGRTGGAPPDTLLDQAELAAAVAYLAEQSPRGLTHELVITPSGDRWTP